MKEGLLIFKTADLDEGSRRMIASGWELHTGPIFEDDAVFWPTTGTQTRPEHLLVPLDTANGESPRLEIQSRLPDSDRLR